MSREYAEHVADMLEPWARVRVKSMFGGFGFYKGETIFAIMIEDTLYFKVTAINKQDYEAAESVPFSYETVKGTKVAMSYWTVPATALDDGTELAAWAEKAYQAALTVKKKAKRKKT